MSGQNTPAGWYPDPQNPGQQRYWDGTTWSEATQPVAVGAPAPAYGQQVGYGYAQGAGGNAANFGQRLGAYILDVILVGIATNIVVFIGGAISDALGLILNLLSIVAGAAYFAYFEGGETGQTIGKKALNIRVVDANTHQPGIGTGRAVGRYLARILSAIPCGLGYFWMLWDSEKQTWHDKIVTTRVETT